MVQPHLPNQHIIPLLIQEQLMVPPQRRIHFAMLIQIRRRKPAPIGACAAVQEQHHALAHVEEEADFAAAPKHFVSILWLSQMMGVSVKDEECAVS